MRPSTHVLDLLDYTDVSEAASLTEQKISYPIGILSFQMLFVSGGIKSEISVAMYPGEMVFARANCTHSTARDLTRSTKCQLLKAET